MPHRSPGSPARSRQQYLSGKPIRYYRPRGSAEIRHLIDEGFQAFNAARLGEACRIFADKMLLPEHDTTIGLTVAGAAYRGVGLPDCIRDGRTAAARVAAARLPVAAAATVDWITISTRRFVARPSAVRLSAVGRWSAYPAAERREGGKPWRTTRSRSTEVARAVDSSQLDG